MLADTYTLGNVREGDDDARPATTTDASARTPLMRVLRLVEQLGALAARQASEQAPASRAQLLELLACSIRALDEYQAALVHDLRAARVDDESRYGRVLHRHIYASVARERGELTHLIDVIAHDGDLAETLRSGWAIAVAMSVGLPQLMRDVAVC